MVAVPPTGGQGGSLSGEQGGLPFGALSSRTCSLPSKERSPLLYFFVKSSITSITKADNSFATRCLWSDRWVIDVIEEVKKLLIIAGSLFAHCLFHRCSSSFAVSDNCCSSHVRLRTSAINQAPALSNSSSCVEQFTLLYLQKHGGICFENQWVTIEKRGFTLEKQRFLTQKTWVFDAKNGVFRTKNVNFQTLLPHLPPFYHTFYHTLIFYGSTC